jgi:hypothetical protein
MNREQKRALERATAKTELAANDPIRVAKELADRDNQVRAAFVMLRFAVDQLGGRLVVPNAQFLASSKRQLHTARDTDGNVVLTVR